MEKGIMERLELSRRTNRLACELIAYADGEHVQQIYTGFCLLHRRGVLNVKQTIPADCLLNKTDPDRWVPYRFSNVKVIVGNRTSVCYDMHDWSWIDPALLAEVDFYFKRSFDSEYVAQLRERHKVFPLGLNYPVFCAGPDGFRLQRSAFYAGRTRIKAVLKALYVDRFVASASERLNHLESYPDFAAEPRVLFMAKAWDTARIPDRTQKEAVEVLNDTRAQCVRRLRKELGRRFFGGLAHDAYSASRFKDALLPDARLADKRQYIEILRHHPICVATTGLNGSTGWKFGEYVALAKAIVTEPLRDVLPGNLAAGTHYLQFNTPDEVAAAAVRLVEDRDVRCAMMMNNYRYYRAFLRPDVLVLNSLAIVVGGVGAPGPGDDAAAAVRMVTAGQDHRS
jgi:hypothetical protein